MVVKSGPTIPKVALPRPVVVVKSVPIVDNQGVVTYVSRVEAFAIGIKIVYFNSAINTQVETSVHTQSSSSSSRSWAQPGNEYTQVHARESVVFVHTQWRRLK